MVGGRIRIWQDLGSPVVDSIWHALFRGVFNYLPDHRPREMGWLPLRHRPPCHQRPISPNPPKVTTTGLSPATGGGVDRGSGVIAGEAHLTARSVITHVQAREHSRPVVAPTARGLRSPSDRTPRRPKTASVRRRRPRAASARLLPARLQSSPAHREARLLRRSLPRR